MNNKFKQLLEKILTNILMAGCVAIFLFLTAFLIFDVIMLAFKVTSWLWGLF